MTRISSMIPAFIETHLQDLSLQSSSQGSCHPECVRSGTCAHIRSVPQAVSVIIPTLNEAANITDLLARIHQSLTAASLSYEVIVVDDHSTDETTAVVQAVTRERAFPVRVLTKQGKTGKSYSLLEGFSAAKFDVVAMIDGDLQYPPEALPLMAQMLTHSDIVVADRGITYGIADGLRGLMSQAFRTLTKLLFGINTDMQSGLKMFRYTIYEKIRCSPGRWSLDLYLITHAVFHGYRLTNVPIKFHERQRGDSKVVPLKVAIELLLTVLKLKVQGRR